MGQLRMSGLISGLDTESIISSLVSVRKIKVTKQKGNQTKLSWQQEIWKDLNKDLKSLMSTASNMRYSTAYAKRTTKASDSDKVSVIASDGAPTSVQSLQITSLAKTAYMTGGKIGGDDSGITALSTMEDLGYTGADTSFNITDKNGNVTKTINITSETTISDVLTGIKAAGLNASFDAGNGRFFISATESGKDSDFNIVSSGESNSASALSALGLSYSHDINDENYNSETDVASKINGSNSSIVLNGATFTSSNNTFSINGLTITANGITEGDEEITLTTENDTSGIYDSIKSFLKTYNTIINKLDKAYNADRAKGYEPLTDEEKEAMSESEVEKYEQKIKDSLLRRDNTVSSIMSGLTGVMSNVYEIDGKKMSLSNFGINTLSYFTAAESERNAYHIDGDPDDENSSGNEDKLKSIIASDPDTLVSFFTSLSQALYSKMDGLSSSVANQRSYGSFYADKSMKKEYSDYTSKINELEEKVNAYEDKLYKQYAAMEKALAKLQSNTSALSGLMGGS
ncbi:MAG: flagellar filament capping protein FliD [Lachnospiraceae bacterium]|nr:flagellar filament capping protein FliD [Lachnospiraceae bacterium]